MDLLTRFICARKRAPEFLARRVADTIAPAHQAPVAQWIEHRTSNPMAVRSNRTGGDPPPLFENYTLYLGCVLLIRSVNENGYIA
jgi:hypothetical protein